MTPRARTDELIALAERYGVSTSYYDWTGQHIEVSGDTLAAVLAALDLDTTSDEAIAAELQAADERPWRRVLAPTTVSRVGQDREVAVHVPDGAPIRLVVDLEDGGEVALDQLDKWVNPREIDGRRVGEATFRIPADMPLGWHRLRAIVPNEGIDEATAAMLGLAPARAAGDSRAGRRAARAAQDEAFRAPADEAADQQSEGDQPSLVATSTLIVTPERPSASVDNPTWGLMTQLYQARSQRSWGIGDLTDLSTLGRWGAEQGADFVLVNPFHAPSPVTPIEPSPYLPTSRRFLDANLVDIDAIARDYELDESVTTRLDELASYARLQHSSDVIDRDAAWLAKREALTLLFVAAREQGGELWREFGDYVDSEGEGLIDFATWAALCEAVGPNWQDWPEALQDPRNEETMRVREQGSERVEFYCWVQFVANRQSRQTQAALREAGMSIGVMHDLAVGVHPSGADSWALKDSLARGVSVGAPPDAFNQLGQNWSQPPLRPDALERLGFRPLRDMLRAAFVGAGALRVDHILGFFRLWWIPNGASADQGTYVQMDHEAMIGVLLLEAERAGALVVGEDLGVVAELTTQVMAERHVMGTQIMWFEHEEDGALMRPENFRVECLATVTTHDLPPTAGYLELAHVHLRDRLGLLTRPVEEELEAERELIDRYVSLLQREGLVGESPTTDEIVVALHERMSRSASRLFGVSVADLAGDRRPINQPGTFREYPNWTLPLADEGGRPLMLEDVIARPEAAEIVAASKRGYETLDDN